VDDVVVVSSASGGEVKVVRLARGGTVPGTDEDVPVPGVDADDTVLGGCTVDLRGGNVSSSVSLAGGGTVPGTDDDVIVPGVDEGGSVPGVGVVPGLDAVLWGCTVALRGGSVSSSVSFVGKSVSPDLLSAVLISSSEGVASDETLLLTQ